MRFKAFLSFASAVLLVWSTVACAQSGDAKVILDAINALNQRIDNLQKQIDEQKSASEDAGQGSSGKESADSKGVAGEMPQSLGGLPAGMRAVAGWSIGVLPRVDGVREPDALFKFAEAKLPVSFNAHLATKNVSDWVKYRGEALLNITLGGRYVFAMTIQTQKISGQSSETQIRCGGYLRIGKNSLILVGDEASENKKDILIISPGSNKTLSGGITLEPGNYDIAFLAACWPHNRIAHWLTDEKQQWQSTSVDVTVRGPDDETLRPFTAKEVFYLVKQKADAAPPADTTGNIEHDGAETPAPKKPVKLVSVSGVRAILKEVINVRAAPSVNAQVAMRLQPGQQIRLVAMTDDEEWHQVAVDNRVVGFIKSSALLAASQ